MHSDKYAHSMLAEYVAKRAGENYNCGMNFEVGQEDAFPPLSVTACAVTALPKGASHVGADVVIGH